jgi:hypothetical protein
MAGEIVKFGDWISGGWKLFTLDMKTWVLASLFHLVLSMIPLVFALIGIYIPILTGGEPNFLVMVPLVVIMPVIMLISIFLSGGMHRMAQKQLRGEKIEVKDIFSCKDRIGRLIGGTVLVFLATFCGLLLFVIGVYPVAALVFFTIPIIVNEDISAIDAITKSYNLVKRDLLMFTLFVFVVMMISQIGANFCLVGLLFTYPLLFTITAVAYRDCFESGDGKVNILAETRPDTPYIYTQPAAPIDVATPFISSCPNCNAYMPVSAAFCPKCGLQR